MPTVTTHLALVSNLRSLQLVGDCTRRRYSKNISKRRKISKVMELKVKAGARPRGGNLPKTRGTCFYNAAITSGWSKQQLTECY